MHLEIISNYLTKPTIVDVTPNESPFHIIYLLLFEYALQKIKIDIKIIQFKIKSIKFDCQS